MTSLGNGGHHRPRRRAGGWRTRVTDDTSGLGERLGYTYFARANYEVAEDVFESSDITRRDTITVIDDPAVAVNYAYSTNEDTPLVVAAPGVLAGSGNLDDPVVFTAQLVSGPSTGTLVLSGDGSFTYTPPLNFSSPTPVTFTYRAVSGAVVTNTATVSITVNSVNDPPTISDIPNQTIPQNTVLGPIGFTVGDVESGTALTVSGDVRQSDARAERQHRPWRLGRQSDHYHHAGRGPDRHGKHHRHSD